MSALPESLTRGGVIGTRQTTFWDLTALETGSRWRATFVRKVESRFEGASFAHAELVLRHPVLLDHQEPLGALYISSPAPAPDALLAELSVLCEDLFAGWRPLSRYLNHDYPALRVLSEGAGMLLRGPRTFVEACTRVLIEHGVRVDPPSRGAARDTAAQLLLLGRSFIVADGFTFESFEGAG